MMHNPSSILPIALVLLALAATSNAQLAEIGITRKAHTAEVTIGGKPFTTYHFGPERTKPVLYPVAGPGGVRMVRDYPFKKDSPGEAHDHPHHESLWYTHGDVNGVSFWHIGKDAGTIVHQKFLESPKDQIVTANNWVGPDKKVHCSDVTRIRFFGLPNDGRGIEYTVTIKADHGDVIFGDTKEGSMGIRTHPALRLKGDVATGKAVNANGTKGKGIWGKPAKWLHYHGLINSKPVGVGIFDHPSNPRHPTTWHARDYGLIAANPFGHSPFLGKPKGAGKLVIKNGESITFKYGFVFVSGDTEAAEIEALYSAWSK